MPRSAPLNAGILINSLPKSGTNLAAKLLDQCGLEEVLHLGAQSRVRGRPLRRQLWWHVYTHRDSCTVGIDHPARAPRSQVEALLGAVDWPGYATAHIPYDGGIETFLRDRQMPHIVMLRDPRAVLWSFTKYVEGEKNHPAYKVVQQIPTTEHRAMAALEGIHGRRHVTASMVERCKWIDGWVHGGSALAVRFEDLVGSRGGGSNARQLAICKEIGEHCGIDNQLVVAQAKTLFGHGRSTFRRGQIDGWREEMPVSVQAAAAEKLDHYLTKWGYSV